MKVYHPLTGWREVIQETYSGDEWKGGPPNSDDDGEFYDDDDDIGKDYKRIIDKYSAIIRDLLVRYQVNSVYELPKEVQETKFENAGNSTPEQIIQALSDLRQMYQQSRYYARKSRERQPPELLKQYDAIDDIVNKKTSELFDMFHDSGGQIEKSKDEYELPMWDFHTGDGKNTYTVKSYRVIYVNDNFKHNSRKVLEFDRDWATVQKTEKEIEEDIRTELINILVRGDWVDGMKG